MSKRTILAVLVVFACAIALVAYLRQRNYNHYNAGEVTLLDARGGSVPAQTEPAAPQTARKEPAGKPLDQPEDRVDASPATPQSNAADTLPSSAPEGVATNGSGRFQVYRQGNLTWRVDTGNGSTCVLFATDEEWQKPRVYRRACQQN